MADVSAPGGNTPAGNQNSDEAAFDETIAGAMESFVPTLVFPLIQKVTEDMKENLE